MTKRGNIATKITAILLGGALATSLAPSAAAAQTQVPLARNVSIVHDNTDWKMTVHEGGTQEGRLILAWPHDYPGQAWELEYQGFDREHSNHVYSIRNERSDKCLEPRDRDTTDGAYIVQMNCSERRTQQWVLDRIPQRDTYQIAPASRPKLGLTLKTPDLAWSWLELGHRDDSRSNFDWRFEER